ncbi:nucleotidyltransferase family protein [Mucilaginibacter aquaedulcis]|uniref:nucleotidyltransferase family protein n=1 Tax=Mucilaginibacter aquaedulcis TaxID=1187081 RepID=UPI0025B2CA79|nr:nucleotidyltransferase family protein [Mucilaginibacter aquaedulcis]MDN3547817.1 nucleotidyltransferase family protein [Mucilaginibacter aquaedulcis]
MTGLIILAAGESSRLGQPKQNLLYNGKTLLQNAIEAGQKSECEEVIVVLGANSHKITPVTGATILHNADWKEGMASSIRMAITEINKSSLVDKAIIMLCDQPFVSPELLNTMIYKQVETGKFIAACTYNNTIGVPALFHRKLFTKLLQLQGRDGAKRILKDHPNDIVKIQFNNGAIDIDTLADYEQLLNLKAN